jgi:tetratricopeptide repeat protein
MANESSPRDDEATTPMKREPGEKRSTFQILQLVFLGIIAFSTGGILVWLVLSNTAAPDSEAKFNPRNAGTGAPMDDQTSIIPSTGTSTIPEHQFEPDVSRLPPQMAAVTLGNWSFDHKVWSKAIEQYEKAISLGLDNPDIRTDLGSAYRFSGKINEALNQYEQAHRQNPQHENSLFNLASLYLQNLNQPAKATELLEDFKARFPQSGAMPRVNELIEQAKNQQGSGSSSPPKSAEGVNGNPSRGS